MTDLNKNQEGLINLAISELTTNHYVVIKNFFPEPITKQLYLRALSLNEASLLKAAQTGRHKKLDANIRGDSTFWLNEKSENVVDKLYLSTMEQIKIALNNELFLGLESLECHFALYPVGTFYKKHLDQFKTNHNQQGATRQVSCILYLNKQWQAADGGELRLYLDEQNQENFLDIAPIGGTLVLFLSSRFYHEVLPAKRERLSLTGWFKTRENIAF